MTGHQVDAKNFKASRRTSKPELQFGTFAPLEVRGEILLLRLFWRSALRAFPLSAA